jgi:radical SAM protein with 4Fe4S-binding SPASM domain
MGEPLLHPEIHDFIKTLGRTHSKNHTLLVTNGHFLDDALARLILDAGIKQVQISLNAHGQAKYQWFTGSSRYHAVVHNIENLIQRKTAHGTGKPQINIHIAGIEEFTDDFAPFLEKWEQKADLARVREIKDWAGVTKGNGITPLIAEEITCHRYPCAWLWECLEFHPSGDIYTCSFHPFFDTPPLGNIATDRLETLWQAKELHELRQKHLQGRAAEIDFCTNCYNWYLFPNFWDPINGHQKQNCGQAWQLPDLE